MQEFFLSRLAVSYIQEWKGRGMIEYHTVAIVVIVILQLQRV